MTTIDVGGNLGWGGEAAQAAPARARVRLSAALRPLAERLGRRASRLHACDVTFVLLLLALAALAFATLADYAISNDEEVQQRYGELILAYYASGLIDQAAFHFKTLYLYGGLFDIIATVIGRVFAADAYFIRHLLCALIGIGGIVAAWGTARHVAGPRAGLLAAAALAVSGVWYGGMFNHTKDIPLAAAMMGATYFLVRAMDDLPRPQWRHVIAFGLLLGAALGQRVTGLLLVAFFTFAIALRMMALTGPLRERARWLVRTVFAFAPAFAIGYVIMIAAWPWAALDILNPIRGLQAFANFAYPINTVLAGQVYDMAHVPRWYVPAYVLIKLPLITLFGASLAFLFAAAPAVMRGAQFSRDVRQKIALIVVAAAFPLACQVIGHGPAFSGMRHFLFVVPPLAVLAGIGLHGALARFARRRVIAVSALAGIVAAFVWDGAVLVRLHPHQYLFYNQLVGGLAGAAGRYDTDYWVNIMPEAVDDLGAFLNTTDRDSQRRLGRYKVAVCGERLPFEKEADFRLQWTPNWDHADFFIAPTHMNCDRVLDGKVIVTITRLGVPIGVVKDRRAITTPAIARNK